MIRVRPPAVAGAFYPRQASELNRQLRELLSIAVPAQAVTVKALIAPHAGYIYSGAIAASAYAAIAELRERIKRVVLVGPAHRVPFKGLALPAVDALATPLGVVPVDPAATLALAGMPQVSENLAAHELEHSLEVQLPFLQTLLDDFSVVPLLAGDAQASEVAQVLDALWGGPETLIVVSSDLSHYLTYDKACAVDRATAQAILDLSPPISLEQACGGTPINGLLLAARLHGLKPRLLDLRNSGDTAGDHRRVVGYAAFAFSDVH
ncbi:MAG: AmmeMemoRadiSam system protein B [Burkholderiales bacterium]